MGEENVTPSEDDLEELLRKAKEARADNNPQQALGYVIEARKKWGDHDRVLFSLATIFSDLGMQDGAITVYRTLRARRPHDPLVLNNLAAALDGTGERDEALAIINEALHHDPQDANLYVTKAIILHHAHALDDAEAALEHALQLDNKHGAAWLNLAEVKTDKGELHDCLACQRRALDVLGPLPLLRFNMAHTLFKLGQLSEAWPLYEARFESSAGQPPRSRPRPTQLPRWDGTTLPDKKLLVWMEQGVGEEILYAGLLEETAQRCPHMAVECAPRLQPLFQRSFPHFSFLPRMERPSAAAEHDYAAHIPAASLGHFFRHTRSQFTPHHGYLKADDVVTRILRDKYTAFGEGPVIGLSWRSAKRRFGDPKSLSPALLARTLKNRKAVFVSLQYGDVADDIATMKNEGLSVIHDTTINPLENLDAFAAQVAACDSILTVSNTTAHMAGALNIKAHVLVPAGIHAPHHWFYAEATSPWYPSLRLFWQKRLGDWGEALSKAAENMG